MTYVVGLTGGIGSGKSTVAALFAAKGIPIIDADVIARQVVGSGSTALAQISARFGPQILLNDGSLNRALLRERVFNHPDDKQWLDALLHPLIIEEMIVQTQQARSPYCLLIIPLLIEKQLQHLCQRILVVDVEEETQIIRTMKRDGIERQLVEKIIAHQISRAERLKNAQDIVKNDESEDKVHIQVEDLHRQYLILSNS